MGEDKNLVVHEAEHEHILAILLMEHIYALLYIVGPPPLPYNIDHPDIISKEKLISLQIIFKLIAM